MNHHIKTIREGLPLIEKAYGYSQARFNYGFTTGQIITCFNLRLIDIDEWRMLSDETETAYKNWEKKNK